MFWHENHTVDLWAHDRPAWFLTLAHGWYPSVADYARWLSSSGLAATAIYLTVVTLCVISLFAAPFVANLGLRIVISALLVIGVGYDLVMYDIGGGIPSSEMTETVLSNVAFGLQGTFQLYAVKIAENCALAIVALAIFCLRPPMLRTRFAWILTVVATATIGVIGIVWRTDSHTKEFPSPFRSYLYVVNFLKGGAHQPIAKVNYHGPLATSLRQVILIVDESVRADYISLNNPSRDTTPFLVSKRNDIANFGVAISAANCSARSQGRR